MANSIRQGTHPKSGGPAAGAVGTCLSKSAGGGGNIGVDVAPGCLPEFSGSDRDGKEEVSTDWEPVLPVI